MAVNSVSCLVVVCVLCGVCNSVVRSQFPPGSQQQLPYPQPTAMPACPRPWTPVMGTKKCLYKSNEKASWIQSVTWCNLLGGNLVEDNAPAISNEIRRLVNMGVNKGKHWLGGTDILSEGSFTWLPSGMPVNRPFQMTYDFMKNCLTVDEKGMWYVESCTAQLWFICEKILK